jgi:Flp pilus assembly protein TadG
MKTSAFSRRLGALRDDRRGNFAILFAAAAVAVSLAAGTAVDVTQALGDRASMANALDAAVLATAKAISSDRIQDAQAQTYMTKVFAGNIGQATTGATDFGLASVRVDTATRTVSATATGTYHSAFAIFGAAGTFPLSTSASASYGSGGTVEVAMAFDLTGSMRGSKIAALKSAAEAGIKVLLDHSDGRVRIAAVPYAAAVNVGPGLAKYVYRDNGDPYAVAPAYDPAAPKLASAGGDTCATERKAALDDPSAGPDRAMVNRDGRLKRGNCPAAPIVPLTSDAGTLLGAVGSFTTGGTTAGHIGIEWAWYMLSSSWSGFVPAGRGAGSGDGVHKYAIIMTDGEFNTAYAGTKRPRQSREAAANSARMAVALCKKMQAQGIDVFTIGFGLNQTGAKKTMQACASPAHDGMTFYYNASTGTELVGVYKEIASVIKKLRLVS